MRKLIVFTIFFLGLCFVYSNAAFSADPQKSKTYKYLSKLSDKKDFVDVQNEIQKESTQEKYLSDSEGVAAYGVWLRDVHFDPKKDLRYGFLYAKHMRDVAEKMPKKTAERLNKVAATAYFVSNLKLMNAISRCDDVGVGLAARMVWSPKPSDYKKLYKQMDEGQQKNVFVIMSQMASNAVVAEPAEWVCLDGAGIMSRAMQDGAQTKETNKGNITNIEIDTSDYVEFISDAEWSKKRYENVVKLAEYLELDIQIKPITK
ncbi:MAG: hypothetical protein CMH32_00440 [Micavibrio sp.]|nr:hypothetical protein [Micavibrio sp.]HCK32954.1 hypothetical protein [Rhodospirillaceae bacterium]|tara:strand:+ start:9 stop:788 length:780 start_codon:yes stop_codon:yes gene_type:complete